MNCNFDFCGRFEMPDLILCNADDSEIGRIINPQNFCPIYKNNEISELSYEIYDECISSDEDLSFVQEIYNKHIERRQVYVTGVGYFIITSVSETENEKGRYKQVTAKSCEYELNNISMPYINGTYALYKVENFENQTNEDIAQQDNEYLNQNCILYEVMKCIPSWTLKQLNFVEDENYSELANTYRTFEYESMSVYAFLKNVIQDKYSCYVSFDISTRTIEILRREDVFKELPIIISHTNILNECNVSTDIDDYVNSLRVEIINDVSIAPFNPMGGTVIYDFTHDIKSGMITGELKKALEFWQERISSKEGQSINITIPLYTSNNFAAWKEFDKRVLDYKNQIIEKISLCLAENKTNTETVDYSELLSNLITYLKEIGLDDRVYVPGGIEIENSSETKKETTISEALKGGACSNTATVEKVFFGILSQKYLLIKPVAATSQRELSLSDASKQLLYLQEYKELVTSELNKEKSKCTGYEAQRTSLDTVITETKDGADVKALNYNKELVNDYTKLTQQSIDHYTKILGSDDIKNVEGLLGGITAINTSLQEKYKYNSFEQAFSDYAGSKEIGGALYSKLTRFLKQQTYQEETIIITDAMTLDEKFEQSEELYKQASKTLSTICSPEYKMSIKAEAFLFSNDFAEIIKDLDMYSAIYVEMPNGEVLLFMLESISLNYDNQDCEITFGNRINPSNPLAVFANLQNTAMSTASVVASERIDWGIKSEKINELMVAKAADIDTTYREMNNSINSVNTGSYGFKCFTEDQRYGIWMANGTMMFVEQDRNGKQQSKAAVGRIIKSDGKVEYGFYGQSIIANSVTTDKLVAGALSQGTNYVRNGSFESGTDYWEVDSESTTTDSSHNAPIGYKYLCLPAGTTATQNLLECGSVVDLRGTYVLSFYYRRKDNGKGIDIGNKSIKIEIIGDSNTIANGQCTSNDNQTAFNVTRLKTNGSALSSYWARCYKIFSITRKTYQDLNLKITNSTDYNVCIDGVMLERASDINDYAPHISETYAKYTTIDDSGITVYDGKINILNKSGTKVFFADNDGNLTLQGKISASSGKIGGWTIDSTKLYNGETGMATSGDYVFYAGKNNQGNRVFSVSQSGELIASNATITGDVCATKLTATQEGKIANWTIAQDALSGGKLILTKGNYRMEFDGYGLRAGLISENSYGMSISLCTASNNIFNNPENDNLAIAGRNVISFGRRTNGNFVEMGRMYNYTITGSTGNIFSKETLEFEALKCDYFIIGGIPYNVHAYMDTKLISTLNPTGRYMALTTLI